ncbi:choice-of-anchor D domain-containing protein [Prevotella sp. E9-3]|uniref:choice-of-anchor D domain-containing protein n=1 Tax=Prevotella sp. E9-3 TaxID=2913621 RepID=UPI001EDAEF22|nr:choice-of-anchor D domain-containing protein [Prevotella sp. E9-3]UKK48809.1 choice-of-anchor D domain-containing protein [Prevotella sp. E9-3]
MRKSKTALFLLLVIMAALFGDSLMASAATKTADFNGGLPEGWSLVGDAQCANDRARTGNGVFSWSKSDNTNYLVTTAVEGTVEFYARAYNKNSASQVIVYEYTASGLGEQLYTTGSLRSSSTPTWSKFSFTLTKATQLAIALNYAAIDDVTYTEADGGEGGGGTPDPQPDPAPVMGISTTTVNFGPVTADVSETITVSNTGNAVLEAAIAVDNNEFTVSPANLSVAAGQSGTFTISYSYNAEAYGGHTATVTVTPNAGDAATIAVSAYVRNPNVWSEDFSGNALPNGWKADASNWTFADGVAHSKYDFYTSGYLTTPILKVATGEVMTFEYKATKNNVKVKIEASKDGGDFTEIKNTGWINKMDDFATFTIDGLQAGNYQFRFASDDYDLDNFEGFNLNLDAPALVVTPTTDAAFGKVSAQPEAKSYTISNAGTGTLTGTITSSDATQFTVSKGEFSLAAGESTTFDVALVMSENYGEKNATITIHPTNEGLADVTINASAILMDPNVWTEDFNEGQLPEGWTNNSWTIGTSAAFDDNTTPMALAPQSNTAGTLTTPRLQAKAGDVLTWDAYLRWSDESLLVEYTTDDQTWTTLYDYKAADEQQGDKYVKAMSFTAPVEGTYRLRFTAKYQNGVDNFCGFALAPSTAVKETWHISYTFHYNSAGGEQSEEDTEDIEVEFDGDKVGFNFPNPFNGKAWMYGTRYEQDDIVYYIFPMGQYVGQYQGESIYYCGGANDTLADMQFFYNDDDKAFFNFEHVLLNGSTTSISLWAYFSDVVIYKNEKPVIEPSGIESLTPSPKGKGSLYNLRGQKVDASYKGIVIQNGKKYLRK